MRPSGMSVPVPAVDLRPDHWDIVRSALRRHVPDREVVAFGSRATWTAKDYSDLDLAVMGQEPLSLRTAAALDEVLGDSDLPFRVDVVEWARIDGGFRKIIRRHGVLVQGAVTSNDVAARQKNPTRPDWPITTIDEIAKRVAMGPFGSSIKVSTFVPAGIPIISGQHLHGTRVDDSSGHNFITEAHADRLSRANVRRGDIVFTHAGSIGQVAHIPESSRYRRYVISQRQFYMRCDRSLAIPGYVTRYFKSPQGQHQLLANASQVGVPSIAQPVSYLRTITIPLPPLPEQRAIAHILGILDDKIELNRRMNETLEAMARALFKSWFVDFDPVRAEMEGRDSGLPKDIADLFPDRMVDSEIGEIPEGWDPSKLGDVATLRRKGIDPTREASDTPYIGLADMPRGSIALTEWGKTGSVFSRKSAFKTGDILFGKLRPYFHKVGIAPVDGLCSTDIVVLGARKPKWSAFVLACVSSSAFVAHTSQAATGTKMPRTSWQAMRQYELCRPTDTIASEFQRIVSPMLRRIVANIHESRTLAGLRDTLLPQLVSGELRVYGAMKLLGTVE